MQKPEPIPLHRSQYIVYFPTILARKRSVGAYQDPFESCDESDEDAH